jgi:acyl-CoA thioesterase
MSEILLFDSLETDANNWEEHWQDMPEYNNLNEEKPKIIAIFKFKNKEEFLDFEKKIKLYLYDNQRVFNGMQSKTRKTAWYPAKEKASNYEYV